MKEHSRSNEKHQVEKSYDLIHKDAFVIEKQMKQ
jgi:hypothetical protein